MKTNDLSFTDKIIAVLRQVANDPNRTPKSRREAARKLAEWEKAYGR